MYTGTASPAARPSIVIVDDDSALLAALKFALETEGLDVAAYRDAESALRAPAAPHACLILDQKLPGISGLDLLDELRSRGETAPVLLITTHPVTATRQRAKIAGAEIMEKPLLGDALVRRVLDIVHSS